MSKRLDRSDRTGRGPAAVVAACGLSVLMGGITALSATAADGPGVRYGVVDLGDRVAFRQPQAFCDQPVAIEVTTPGGTVVGPSAIGCEGTVTVPDVAAIEATGWHDDGPIDIELVTARQRVRLRYMRLQAELGEAAGGEPQISHDAQDPRGGGGAAILGVGDVIDLGEADLRGIRSISMRTSAALRGTCDGVDLGSCAPTRFELRTERPTGPVVAAGDVGPVGILAAYNGGWSDSWVMTTWKLIGDIPPGATHLYLAVTAAPAPASINWVDLNGSGIRLPRDVVDPPGTRVLFDGTSFDGWNNRGFTLRDGAMRAESHLAPDDTSWLQPIVDAPLDPYPKLNAGGSVITSVEHFHNVSIRLQFRHEHFEDNGSIILGPVEIQMTDSSEWFTGGIPRGETCLPPYPPGGLATQVIGQLSGQAVDCGVPAERIKSGTYPDWTEMEILQNGGTWIVLIEGREVSRTTTPETAPYAITLNNSPLFSRRLEVGSSSGIDAHHASTPDEWGHIWFRNIRVVPIDEATTGTAA